MGVDSGSFLGDCSCRWWRWNGHLGMLALHNQRRWIYSTPPVYSGHTLHCECICWIDNCSSSTRPPMPLQHLYQCKFFRYPRRDSRHTGHLSARVGIGVGQHPGRHSSQRSWPSFGPKRLVPHLQRPEHYYAAEGMKQWSHCWFVHLHAWKIDRVLINTPLASWLWWMSGVSIDEKMKSIEWNLEEV